MKELPEILELIKAILREKLGEPQNPLPGPGAQSESSMLAFDLFCLALQKHYSTLSLWAIGHYRRVIAPIAIQELVNDFLLDMASTAFFGGSMSGPPSFEGLQQQLQTFIDSGLDLT